MSEQALEEQEEKAEEVVEEEQEEEDKGEDKGTDFVELTADQEARFNRIYGNMKQYERVNAQLLKDQKTLLQKTERLQEKLDGVVQNSTDQRLESLRAEKVAAYEAGEIDRVIDIDEKIAAAREAPRDPEPEPEPESEGIPEHIANAIEGWSNEIGEDGLNYKRPWAFRTHPKFNQAIGIAQEVMDDQSFKGARTDEVLAEIDKRVETTLFPKKQRVSPVLSADGKASPNPGKTTKLSADQKEAAHNLYNKLSPKEAEARYAKALEA